MLTKLKPFIDKKKWKQIRSSLSYSNLFFFKKGGYMDKCYTCKWIDISACISLRITGKTGFKQVFEYKISMQGVNFWGQGSYIALAS